MHHPLKTPYLTLLLLITTLWSTAGFCADMATLDRLVSSKNINVQALRSMGPAIMPDLVALYRKGDSMRLQIQWALGRVSDDTEVVQVLLDKMMNDPNPLFRDKAACALASDQIHLNDHQRVEILNGLITGMASNNPQVRDISIKAMQIQTGQTKQFSANASADQRAKKIRNWRLWLDEYKSNL